MALSHSPLIVTDGLVFMYDTGNRKSYVGEPTENGITTPDLSSGVSPYNTHSTSLTDKVLKITLTGVNSSNRAQFSHDTSFNTAQTATMSIYAKGEGSTVGKYLQTYSGASWTRSIGPLTSEFKRFNTTITTGGGSGGPGNMGLQNGATGDVFYIHSPQLEANSHVTPFVNGTRSATQGLIDRTGNSTIDISNASFDSNAQMVFDGTDDFISIPTYTFGNGSWTLNMWVKADDFVNYNLMSNSSGGPVTNAFGAYDNKIFYYNYNGAWQGHSGNTTLSTNTWYMLTWVNYAGASASAGTMKMYVNGIADSSAFNSYTTNGGPCNAIGKRWGGTPFNGNISGVSINTKSLSDAEVLQNYNAIKSRFGL